MGNELQKKDTAVVKIRKMLDDPIVQQQFQRAWSENASAFQASVLSLVSSDKKLQECRTTDILHECLKAAVLKLPLGNELGLAYIIAFKGIPTLIPGYRGLIQLAIRTGQYKHINADAIWEGETVTTNRITGEIKITGEPTSNKAIGYFAYFKLLNGFAKAKYMTKAEVIAHAERYSPAYRAGSAIWKKNFDEMGIKTPLRLLLDKYGIKSIDMLKIEAEEEAMERTIDIKPEEPDDKKALTQKTDKKEVTKRKPKTDKPEEGDWTTEFLAQMKGLKDKLGNKSYYATLNVIGNVKHANEIKVKKVALDVYKEMMAALDLLSLPENEEQPQENIEEYDSAFVEDGEEEPGPGF